MGTNEELVKKLNDLNEKMQKDFEKLEKDFARLREILGIPPETNDSSEKLPS